MYRARKVRHQLQREGIGWRRTVERLIRPESLRGVVRGNNNRTTIQDDDAARADVPVDRSFEADAPNVFGWPTSSTVRRL